MATYPVVYSAQSALLFRPLTMALLIPKPKACKCQSVAVAFAMLRNICQRLTAIEFFFVHLHPFFIHIM